MTKQSHTPLPSLLRTAAILLVVSLIFSSPALEAETVESVNISGLSNISEDIVRDVIDINPGDEFSAASVEKAIASLRKWGVFEKAEVIQSDEAGGRSITFDLQEAMAVVSIDIDGNYPYVENKIRKYLSLHPGDVFTPAKLEEQIERVKAFYAREGYVGTDILVDEENLPEWGGVVLTFHIKHGVALRYRKIDVEGNKAFPKGRFITELNPYRQFSERRLSESLREIKEAYQERGYPRARVKIKSKKMDFEAGRVDIVLDVQEGPFVKLAFKGAPRVGRRLMKRTVTILKEGSVDQYEIEASAFALKEMLRAEGYPDASVEGKKVEHPDGTIVVTFFMDEGKEQRIRWLEFKGNQDVDSSELSVEMRNRAQSSGKQGVFLPEEEAADNEAILKAMRRRGYLDAQVEAWKVGATPQGYALDLTIPLIEGPQTLVGDITFDGNKAFNVGKLMRAIKSRPGKPFDEPELEGERQRLYTFYADNGYPYAEIGQEWELDPATGKAIIAYNISEGTLVRIGQILIIGDVLTSQKAIKNAMEIHERDVFSFRKIMDSQLNIRRLGPFSAVNIETIGIEERESRVHIKVKVEEQRPFMVDLGFGYSTDEKFTGSIAFTNVNAFGWAKSNTFKLTAGQKFSRGEISWFDPRFFSSSFEMTTTGWIQYKQRPSYAFAQVGGAMGWFRRLKRFGFYFRYELDRNYFVTGDSVAADADSLRNNTVSRVSISSSYDSRDSFSNPTKGFFTVGGADLFNEIKGRHANFFKFFWQGENDVTFWKRITLSTAMRFNRIETIGRNVSVPTNELLFLGGDDTIRGFSEDSLGPIDAAGKATGARTRWIFNEELRIRIFKTLDWAFFYDMGSLTENFSQIDFNTIRNSVGFGLRYLTPVGPIRAEYGFKLDRRSGESPGRFHFTFGYLF